ncbi:iron reductase [Cubamyces lactineus]|nr:iron reductase [Cubamyces lactineus]
MNSSVAAAPHYPPVDPNRAIAADYNKQYPRQVWWLVASFIALVSLCQFANWVIAKLSAARASVQKQVEDTEAGESPAVRRFSWRRIPLALVNAYRVIAFRCTLQIGQSYTLNLAEVFVTCAYIVAIFTWEFVNTTTLAGHRLDISYWGGRAGAIGASQFPLITVLGTKNNVLAYITGISYDKLNYVHRMAARVVFVLLWVHGGSKIAHLVPASYDEWFIRVGLTALVAFSILILVSLRPIRAQVYETFYFTHFLTVLILLLGAYFHTNDKHVGSYIWPCFLIWGLDRALRLTRLVYYNHLYFGFSSTAHRLDASVELLSPHFVRLHIQRPPHFTWTPGQTAFLTMPGVSGIPFEAHPFTIASVDARYQLNGVKTPRTADMEKPASEAGADATPFWKELVFLINVREGFTKRLAQIARRGEKVKVLVDGPYGFSPNLDNDDTVVLVAGGSGVSFTLSTFLGVLSHVQDRKSKCRRLVFVWSIRDANHIEWVSKTLTKALELAPSDIEISIRIFVTSGKVPELAQTETRSFNEDDSVHSSSDGTAIGKSRPSSLLNFSVVQVSQGRPDLRALLREEVDANTGRLSVTVCGSQGIARTCRSALKIPMSVTLNGGPSVVLHVESFGYA